MEAKASIRYLRVSPQKARLVADLIRGKSVDEALAMLTHTKKAVGRDMAKLVKSALANAENNMNLDVDSLFVKRAYVDNGPSTKRMRPRAMGRGNILKKRTSHITVVLDEK
ncbi:MAG: 50S ribosomal protein L22 [Thermodesulfobacteriota bacterium]